MSNEYIHLLSRTSQGDRSAFERLYQLTSPRLYAVCLQMMQEKQLAEDVLQDAYIRIWHNASEFRQDKGSALSWMISIARYRALDLLRSGKVRRETSLADSAEPAGDHADGPHRDLAAQHDRATIDDCMEALEPQQRNAIHLAYFRGYTHPEIGRRLSSPLGSVKTWIRRGLDALRRCLGQ